MLEELGVSLRYVSCVAMHLIDIILDSLTICAYGIISCSEHSNVLFENPLIIRTLCVCSSLFVLARLFTPPFLFLSLCCKSSNTPLIIYFVPILDFAVPRWSKSNRCNLFPLPVGWCLFWNITWPPFLLSIFFPVLVSIAIIRCLLMLVIQAAQFE